MDPAVAEFDRIREQLKEGRPVPCEMQADRPFSGYGVIRQRELSLDGDELTALADNLQQRQSSPSDHHAHAPSSAQLQQALASLPPRQRLALAMWAYGDAEVSEIAHTLRIDPNAAHQLLHRAKRSLRDKFSGESA